MECDAFSDHIASADGKGLANELLIMLYQSVSQLLQKKKQKPRLRR